MYGTVILDPKAEFVDIGDLLAKHKDKLDSISYPIEKMMLTQERRCLGALALEYCKTGEAIFEFGTWRGYTTKVLADLLPSTTVYSLDNPIGHGESNAIATEDTFGSECKGTKNVVLLRGDSFNYNITEHVKEKCFMVFVDGDHTYKYVKNDTELANTVVRAGSIIVCHNYYDFNAPDVTKYIDSTEFKWKHIGKTGLVYRVVE